MLNLRYEQTFLFCVIFYLHIKIATHFSSQPRRIILSYFYHGSEKGGVVGKMIA